MGRPTTRTGLPITRFLPPQALPQNFVVACTTNNVVDRRYKICSISNCSKSFNEIEEENPR